MMSIFALRSPYPSARRRLFRPPSFRLGLPLRQGLVAIISAALFACVDQAPTQHHQQTGTAGSLASGDDNPSFTLLGELEFEQIAAKEPGFAGFFYEGSTLVALVNNSAARSVVGQTVLQTVSATQDPMSVPQSVVVREVEFSFSQLRDWRDAAFGPLDGMKGVTFLDLDEAHNRITVGVVEAGDAEPVQDALLKLGIPGRAINVEVTGPIIDLSSHGDHSDVELDRRSVDAPQFQTLRSRLRPVRGGTQIKMETPWGGGWGPCTLGFSATRVRGSGAAVDGFVTASHCTNETARLDGTPIFQSEHLPDHYIGVEVDDPEPHPCFVGLDFEAHRCRYSDAALFEYADDVGFEVGMIARTTWRSTNPRQSGSITINSFDPYFEVFWTDKYPSHGETVHKVGRTSGWTAGPVKSTCTVMSGDGWKLLCQYAFSGHILPGDSGSPVFKWDGLTRPVDPPDPPLRENGSGETLTGIVWGATDPIAPKVFTTTLFSPLGGVEADLGQLEVLWEGFSATIAGPMVLEPGETGTWWGSASGGTSPYSYEWSGVLSGTGSSITGELWSSGTLDLTVTDAYGTEASTHIIVCVLQDEDGPDVCPL